MKASLQGEALDRYLQTVDEALDQDVAVLAVVQAVREARRQGVRRLRKEDSDGRLKPLWLEYYRITLPLGEVQGFLPTGDLLVGRQGHGPLQGPAHDALVGESPGHLRPQSREAQLRIDLGGHRHDSVRLLRHHKLGAMRASNLHEGGRV